MLKRSAVALGSREVGELRLSPATIRMAELTKRARPVRERISSVVE